jgi:hypothetical protein
MAADPDLLAAFDKAYDWFNQHNFTEQSWAQTMDGLLDDYVKMKKLDDPGYHEGKAAVKNYYLRGNGFSDQASITFRNKDCQIVGNLGFISGIADFVDQDGTNHNPPSRSLLIAYSFTYSKASGSWKAVHFWGAYVTPR